MFEGRKADSGVRSTRDCRPNQTSVTINFNNYLHPTFYMNNRFPLYVPLLLSLSSFAVGQYPALLRPPEGAQVALIVFEHLHRPKCRRAAPLAARAARAPT